MRTLKCHDIQPGGFTACGVTQPARLRDLHGCETRCCRRSSRNSGQLGFSFLRGALVKHWSTTLDPWHSYPVIGLYEHSWNTTRRIAASTLGRHGLSAGLARMASYSQATVSTCVLVVTAALNTCCCTTSSRGSPAPNAAWPMMAPPGAVATGLDSFCKPLSVVVTGARLGSCSSAPRCRS
jgi:hypothetical protein